MSRVWRNIKSRRMEWGNKRMVE